MQALLKTSPGVGNMELKNVPIPRIAPNEVLVRVHACGICGSDLKIEDDQHPSTPPVIVGHEFSGEKRNGEQAEEGEIKKALLSHGEEPPEAVRQGHEITV